MASRWTTVLNAAELGPGDAREVQYDGADLLVFRTGSGTLRAMDAYCPHMRNYIPGGLVPGQDLSSLVKGDAIECPFHGWQFDGCGHCSGLPQGQRTPPRVAAGARIMRSWEVREKGGAIQIGSERPVSPGPAASR